jgi:hypothetical protein
MAEEHPTKAETLRVRIDRFLTEASWMTPDEIAGKARLLLREALDTLPASPEEVING